MAKKITQFVKSSIVPIVLFGGLILFLLGTDPLKLSIGWLILPFVWLYATFFFILHKLLGWLASNVKSKRVRYYSAVLAAFPTILLILSSISQLNISDFMLLTTGTVVAIFYINRLVKWYPDILQMCRRSICYNWLIWNPLLCPKTLRRHKHRLRRKRRHR